MAVNNPSSPLPYFLTPNTIGKLIRGAGIAFVAQSGGAVIGYLVQILLARWLGASGYGFYTYLLTWAQILVVIAMLGLDVGILRFIPEYVARQDKEHLGGILRWSRRLVISTGSLFAAAIATTYLVVRPTAPEMPAIMAGAVIIPLLALSELQTQTLRSFHKIAWAYLPPLVLLPIAVAGFTYVLFQTVHASSSAIALGAFSISLIAILAAQAIGIRQGLQPLKPSSAPAFEIGRWLRVSIPLLFSTIFSILLVRTDVLLLGFFLGTQAVGIYSVAVKTATMVSFPLLATNAIIAPMIATYQSRCDLRGLQQIVRWSTLGAFWSSVLIGVGIISVSEPLLRIFGPEFQLARLPLLVLVLGQLANVGFGPVGLLLALSGNERQSVRILGWCALGNFSICLISIPLFGILGAAVTAALSMVVWNAWMYRLVAKNLGIRPSILILPSLAIFHARGDENAS